MTSGSSRVQLIRTGAVGLSRVASIVVAFGLQAALTRTLTPREYGLYAIVTAWVWVMIGLGKGGLEPVAVRFVAEYALERPNESLLRAFRRFIHRRVAITSILAALLWAPYAFVEYSNVTLVVSAMITVPILASIRVGEAELRGTDELIVASNANALFQPGLVLSLFLSLQLRSSSDPNETTVLVLTALSSIIVLLGARLRFAVRKRRLEFPPSPHLTVTPEVQRTWAQGTGWLMLYGVAGLILGQSDIVLVGVLEGEEAAGVYNVGWKVAAVVGLPLIATNLVLAPQIARRTVAGSVAEIRPVLRRSTWFCTIASLLMGAVLILGRDLLLGLFGSGYGGAAGVLTILVLSQIANAAGGPVANLLLYAGHKRHITLLLAGTTLLNIVLSVGFGLAVGSVGVATGTAISLLVYNLLLSVSAQHFAGFAPSPFVPAFLGAHFFRR